MAPEAKKRYYQMASQSTTTCQFNKRHETERVVNNLRDSVRISLLFVATTTNVFSITQPYVIIVMHTYILICMYTYI